MAARFKPERQAAWKDGVCPMPENYDSSKPASASPSPAVAKKASSPPPQEEKKEAPAPTDQKGKKQKQAQQSAAKTAAPAAGASSDLLSVFKMCDLRVGKILECAKHAESDKLYIEQIDLGEGRIRTIGSGLQQLVTMEEMLEGQIIVFANLKSKRLGGVPSEGMVLCASNENHSEC